MGVCVCGGWKSISLKRLEWKIACTIRMSRHIHSGYYFRIKRSVDVGDCLAPAVPNKEKNRALGMLSRCSLRDPTSTIKTYYCNTLSHEGKLKPTFRVKENNQYILSLICFRDISVSHGPNNSACPPLSTCQLC